MKKKLIGTRIQEKEKEAFKQIVRKYNLSESALIRMMVQALLKDESIISHIIKVIGEKG